MKQEFSAWTPVKTEQEDGCFSVSVWGRTYRFDHSLLPTEIITAGRSVLSAPMELKAEFGGTVGEWHDFWYLVTEESEESVTVLVSANCENVIANATVTIEFDGFVKTELRLMNHGTFGYGMVTPKVRLTGLSLNVSVAAESSTLFHYWPNAKNSIAVGTNVINAGATETVVFPFKPYVWTGWEDGGLGLFCGESEKGFELDDSERCIEVEKAAESTNITLHFLDHTPCEWAEKGEDKWSETVNPLTYCFGFQATPVKPLPEQREEYYKRMHAIWTGTPQSRRHPYHGEIYRSDYVEKCAEAGVKWLILHEEWTVIQNYGRPQDEEKFKQFVEKCHRLGMKVMVYFGYEYSSLVPEFNRRADDYLIKTTNGSYGGGWQRTPYQRDFMVCYRGGYSDEMIRRVEHVMDDYGVDGIYTDGTFVPWECANESHGCGWRDREGALHICYPVLAVREHVKKLYRAIHKRGGILDTHQSSCCMMPTLSFCDSYYDGENIQGLLQNHPEAMTTDSFRAEFYGRNLGIPCNFIAYSANGYPMSFPAAFSLVHDVFPRPSQIWDLPYMAKIWEIFDKYSLNEAEFAPYFSQREVMVDQAVVSLYRGADTVAAVYDVTPGRETAQFHAPGFSKAEDLFSGAVYELKDGKAELPAKLRELQLYRLS